MIKILQEQALNYKLNPLLQVFCKSEIQELCKANVDSDEHGQLAECLKTAFLQKQIINRQCQMEVATLIAEAKADIHVDPIWKRPVPWICCDTVLRCRQAMDAVSLHYS